MKFSPDLAIDLGTSNFTVFRPGKGIVLEEPTVVAVSLTEDRVLAIGSEARDMIGRTPHGIKAVQPLREGVIADYTVTLHMLRHVIERFGGPAFRLGLGPDLLLTVPSGVTNVERRAVTQAARRAGARRAWTIEEPMAAALGADLPVEEPGGNMVVDLGGGTTDIAVISLGGTAISQSLRLGGEKFDEAIVRHVRNEYNLLIGESTAEGAKIAIGSAIALEEELTLEVRGRDMLAGLPKAVVLSSQEIREALGEPLRQICDKVCAVLEETPPELSADVIERGIVLTGGGALLRGLDRLIAAVTDVPVRVADDPRRCVVKGAGKALAHPMESRWRVAASS